MTSAVPLIPAERPEPAIKANAAPGTNSPAPLGLAAHDGEPGIPSDCAGRAKKASRLGSLTSLGGRPLAYISAKQSQAVTNSTLGRTARSGRTPFPAPRRATPLVVGARVRRSPLRKGQNLAVALRENAKRAPDFLSPAPLIPLASDGRPRTLSDCAGGAKMRGLRTAHAGRARVERGFHSAKQSQAVTLFTRWVS